MNATRTLYPALDSTIGGGPFPAANPDPPAVKDWQGREVIGPESPDAQILVWEIEPATEDGYRSTVARGYQDALEVARATVEYLMDSADPDVIRDEPITLTIKLTSMSLARYTEILDADN